MKIVNFIGGLGNQCFQYLFYVYLKDKCPEEKIYGFYGCASDCHNGLEIDKWFDVVLPSQPWFIIYLKKFLYLLKRLHIKNYIVDEYNFNLNGILYDAYWQNKKFFLDYLPCLIYKDIVLENENKIILGQMHKSNSVSLHIRRGDYLLPQNALLYSNVCNKSYYQSALNIININVESPNIYIFSDDIKWVKENLNIKNAIYVDWNTGLNSFYDMYLMSCCRHHIIANSTFSFWAAILGEEKNSIIIYPKKWFNNGYKKPDIQPDNWISV